MIRSTFKTGRFDQIEIEGTQISNFLQTSLERKVKRMACASNESPTPWQSINSCRKRIILIKQKNKTMGTCTASLQRKPSRELPLLFKCETPTHRLNHTLEHEFQFELSNVALLPLRSNRVALCFMVGDSIRMDLEKANMKTIHTSRSNGKDDSPAYEVKWNQSLKKHFTCTEAQLASSFLYVGLGFDGLPPTEIIRLSLYLIVNGPYHHSIEITLGDEIFRVLFDLKISHLFEAHMEVAQLSLQTDHLLNSPHCHFTLRALQHQQIIVESEPSYSIEMPTNIQMDLNSSSKYFQEECPSSNKIRRSGLYGAMSESQMETAAAWKAKNQGKNDSDSNMPSLTIDISTQELSQHSLQLLVWSSNQSENRAEYLCEARIPLWKLLEREFTDKMMSIESKENKGDQVCIEERYIKLNEKLYCHHNIIGSLDIVIHMKNEKLIEQAKYCSRTEDGIVNLAPSAMAKDVKSNSKTIHQLWKQVQEIDQLVKGASKNTSLEGAKSHIGLKLIRINDKLCLSKNQLLYSDNNKFEALPNNQNILLTLIEKLFPFIDTSDNPTLCDLSWAIILSILKRNEFNLQNLSLKGTYQTPQAKSILLRKKEVGLKYKSIINKLVEFAINSYDNIYGDHQISNKFLSFCFFRVVKFRDEFFKAVKINEEDKNMEKKLLEFQNEMEPKTSFSNHFIKMQMDWEKYFYDELKDYQSPSVENKELPNYLSKMRFFTEIEARQELFYDFISQILKSLPKIDAGGAQKWKYIEGYSKLVGIILSEMKQKPIEKYMSGIIHSSILLLHNEHLINVLMPLVCEKVNAHQLQKVQMVLDLLSEYLEVITAKRTMQLPATFNQNYFFEIIKIIIEGEHFYNINRILIIIFNYYHLLSDHGKNQIAMYLMGRPFFKLFYHWSNDVRNTFYNVLIIRIKGSNSNDLYISARAQKVISIIKIIYDINERTKRPNNLLLQKSLFKKLKNRLYDKSKNVKTSKTTDSKTEFSLDAIYRVWEEENMMSSREYVQTCQDFSSVSIEAASILPSFHTAQNLTLDRKKRTYSQNYSTFEEFSMSSPVQQRNSEQIPESITNKKSDNTHDSGRKKRRPSLFISSKTNNSSKQYTSTIINELHYLSEITSDQMKNIAKSKRQFDQIEEEIQRYAFSHEGKFPQRNFMEKNRKDIVA